MLFTIGHSNHPKEAFIELLHRHGVTAVGDVRSHPYSRYVPQYSREPLKVALARAGIAYVFLGKELGARSENPACYKQGKAQYDCLAKQPQFADGVRRVIEGMQRHTIALMCAEKDPLECHRTLLVARKLHEAGLEITHIHADSSLENHRALETRLLGVCKLPEGDMFKQRDEFVSEAYAIQGERVAYQDEKQHPTTVIVGLSQSISEGNGEMLIFSICEIEAQRSLAIREMRDEDTRRNTIIP